MGRIRGIGMSGSLDYVDCPNCGREMNSYVDHKPYPISESWCIHCGFYGTTKTGQMDLETLNNYRKEWNEDYNDEDDELLEMYTELPNNTFKD